MQYLKEMVTYLLSVLCRISGQFFHRLAKRLIGPDPDLVSQIQQAQGALKKADQDSQKAGLEEKRLAAELAQLKQQLAERLKSEELEAEAFDQLRAEVILFLRGISSWRTKMEAVNIFAGYLRQAFAITPEEERQGLQQGSQTASELLAAFFAQLPRIHASLGKSPPPIIEH